MLKQKDQQQAQQSRPDQLEKLIEKQQKIANLIALRNIERMINKDSKIKIDITRSQYKLLKTIALKSFGWRLWSREEQKDDANIIWVDHYVSQDFVRKLKPYQKINHFPNSYVLGRKDYLAQSLHAAKKLVPQHYCFYPKTWVLPDDSVKFQKFRKQKPHALFIIKPPASCQGRGIYISYNIDSEDVQNLVSANSSAKSGFNSTWTNGFAFNYGAGNNIQGTVVQQYLSKPLLLDGFKFDFRLYVLVKSLDPLKIFLYSEGLARLATHQYKNPCPQNFSDLFMHLTNYAINKNSPQFMENRHQSQDDTGHKRTYTSVMKRLKQLGCNVIALQNQIDQLVVKTILGVHRKLLQSYKSARQSRQQYSSVCFQVYGFDIMITSDFKPWLIEVNHSPSFTAGSPLDTIIKKYLLLDTINLMNIDNNQKIDYLKRPQETGQRTHFPKTIKTKKAVNDQTIYQDQHMGGYRRIYPIESFCKTPRNNFLQLKIISDTQSPQSQIYKQIIAKTNQKPSSFFQLDQKLGKNFINRVQNRIAKRRGKLMSSQKGNTVCFIERANGEKQEQCKIQQSQNLHSRNKQQKFKSEQDYINFSFYNLFNSKNILERQDEYDKNFEDKNKSPMKMNNVNINFFGPLNSKRLKELKKRSMSEDTRDEKPKSRAQMWFKERIYETQFRSRINRIKQARIRLQKVHKQQKSVQKQKLYMPTDFRKVNG